MALTNAERQARYKARQKQKVEEASKGLLVSCPETLGRLSRLARCNGLSELDYLRTLLEGVERDQLTDLALNGDIPKRNQDAGFSLSKLSLILLTRDTAISGKVSSKN